MPPRVFESSKPFDDDFLRDNSTLNQPSVGTKLEGLLLDDLEDDFNPRAFEGEGQTTTKVVNNTSPTGLFNGNSTSPPLCKNFGAFNILKLTRQNFFFLNCNG